MINRTNNLACKISNSEGASSFLMKVDTEFSPVPIIIPTKSISCKFRIYRKVTIHKVSNS